MNILQQIAKQTNKVKSNNLKKKYITHIKEITKNSIKDAIVSCPICYNKQTKHSIVLFTCGHACCVSCLHLYFIEKKFNYSTCVTLMPTCIYAKIDNYNVIGTSNKPKCFLCNQDTISFCIQKPIIQRTLVDIDPYVYVLLQNIIYYTIDFININTPVYYHKITKKENYKLYNAKIKKCIKNY